MKKEGKADWKIDIKELQEVILYDLEALKDCYINRNRIDFDYHFKLCKGNIKDYFKEGKKQKLYRKEA